MGQRLIGVDVGGTKVSVAVLEDGRFSEPAIGPTDLSSSDALVAQLVDSIRAAGEAEVVGRAADLATCLWGGRDRGHGARLTHQCPAVRPAIRQAP